MKKTIFILIFCLFSPITALPGKDGQPQNADQERKIHQLRKALQEARIKRDEKKIQEIQQQLRQLRGNGRKGPRGNRPHRGNPFWQSQKLLIQPPNLNIRDIAHYGIAQIYLQQRDYDKAIVELRMVNKGSPDLSTRSAAQFSIANIYLLRKDFQKALLAYLRVEGPFRQRSLLIAIQLLRRAKNLEKMAELFDQFLKNCKSPREKAMAHLIMANVYRKHKKFDLAIAQLRAITKMNYQSLSNAPKKPWKKNPQKAHPPQKKKPIKTVPKLPKKDQ